MDNQPTRKKSKVDEIVGNVPSSGQRLEVSRGEERLEHAAHVEDLNKDYFTPAIMDIWPKILDYVTNPEDIVYVMNASAVIGDLLKKRKASALLPLVLPILLKQGRLALAPRDVFNCRLVSKQVKASVDELLANGSELRSRCIRRNSWMLVDATAVQAFMDGTHGFLTGNPFVGRHCEATLDVDEEEQLTNVIEIFRKFGHELLSADLRLTINSSPRLVMETLKRVLPYLSNAQSLKLEFPGIEYQDEEEWRNYRTNHLLFPPLEALRTLILNYGDRWRPNFIPHLGSFVRPIIKAYGNQLTRFRCDSLFFREPCRIMHFRNLLELEVQFINGSMDDDELKTICKNMTKLSCPWLESLSLGGPSMELTAETFLLLNKFRRGLKKLRIEDSSGEEIQPFLVDPFAVRKFPKLTSLTLCRVDVETPARHLFRTMFPKLQELRFEPSLQFLYPISVDQSIPRASVRRSYFTIFSHLKKITWIEEFEETEVVWTRLNNV